MANFVLLCFVSFVAGMILKGQVLKGLAFLKGYLLNKAKALLDKVLAKFGK
jgi:hypothetical protein